MKGGVILYGRERGEDTGSTEVYRQLVVNEKGHLVTAEAVPEYKPFSPYANIYVQQSGDGMASAVMTGAYEHFLIKKIIIQGETAANVSMGPFVFGDSVIGRVRDDDGMKFTANAHTMTCTLANWFPINRNGYYQFQLDNVNLVVGKNAVAELFVNDSSIVDASISIWGESIPA